VENEELTEDQAAALERRRAPKRRVNFPRYSAEEMRRRRCHRRRCQTSWNVGTGVEQVDGGAGSLFSRSGGGAQGTEERRKKTMVWGKKERFTPAALFIHRQVRVMGVVVLHYPDRFCGKSPRGGMEWGGGSYNRATTQ
jgi:hypothetical protein